MKRNLFLVIILFQFFHIAEAQFYSTGEAPASIKWKDIKTTHFRIVFPSELAENANRLANLMEFYHPLTWEDSLPHSKRRVSVLLQQSNVFSNGYVTLAPQRMELFTTPPQDSYAQDWLSQLTLHESRHVYQLDRLNRGFTKGLSWLTGEIGRGIVSAQVPSWFYEGDAVYNETILSRSGRGKQPGFEMPLKTILTTRSRVYSYDKSLFGSYRDFVPDHYLYGYQMVKFGRSRYGNEIWNNTLKFTARHPFLIWPGSIHLKTNYGVFNAGMYRQTMDSLKKHYNNNIESFNYSNYKSINVRQTGTFTSFRYAFDVGEGKIITLRSGYTDPGSFVVIDSTGKQKRLLMPGNTRVGRYDYHKGLLVWNEARSDPRWKQRSYSVIRTLSTINGRKKFLTRKSRYFSPAISPEGGRIAVSENKLNGENFLTIIDAASGKKLQQVEVGENQVVTPEWISNGEIAYIRVSHEGKQLESINLFTRKIKILIPFTPEDFSDPVACGDYLLFSATWSGIDNIWSVNRKTGQLRKITNSRTGARHPTSSSDGRKIYFSEYGFNGYKLAVIDKDTALWEVSRPNVFHTAEHYAEPAAEDFKSYPVTAYKKTSNLIRFHSWLPFYADINAVRNSPEDLDIKAGALIFSQNLLSTLIASFGYSYDKKYHYFHPRITWSGWYPVLELTANVGGPGRKLVLPEGMNIPDNDFPHYDLNLRAYVPLVFNRGRSNTYFRPEIEFERSAIYYSHQGELLRGVNFMHSALHLSNYRQMAFRDIYPRLGQTITATYSKAVWNSGLFGDLYSIQGSLFLPGFFKHHHFVIKAGYQKQNPERFYIPVSRVDYPRGYFEAVSREFTSFKVNYAFPAGYPDFALGPLMYLKRFRLNLFGDISYGTDIRESKNGGGFSYTGYYRSLGAEFISDMHMFRLIFPLSAGIRIGYLPNRDRIFSEFLIQIDTESL